MSRLRLHVHLSCIVGSVSLLLACGASADNPASEKPTSIATIATQSVAIDPATDTARPTIATVPPPTPTSTSTPTSAPTAPPATPTSAQPVPETLIPSALTTALLEDLYREASQRVPTDVPDATFGKVTITVYPFAHEGSQETMLHIRLDFKQGAGIYSYDWDDRTKTLEYKGQTAQLMVFGVLEQSCDKVPWQKQPGWEELLRFGYRAVSQSFPEAADSHYTLEARSWARSCQWLASYWHGTSHLGDYLFATNSGPQPVPTATLVPTPTPVSVATSGVLEITATDTTLGFDIASVEVQTGTEVKLIFKNTSSVLQHSWVLLNGGDDVAQQVMDTIINYIPDYIPTDNPHVLAYTKMTNPGESDTVTFTAPAPGTYLYLCTFPGLYETGMKGSLVVKP
jgi:azurin